jgi:hypothetical protein
MTKLRPILILLVVLLLGAAPIQEKSVMRKGYIIDELVTHLSVTKGKTYKLYAYHVHHHTDEKQEDIPIFIKDKKLKSEIFKATKTERIAVVIKTKTQGYYELVVKYNH